MSLAPRERLRLLTRHPVRPERTFVLYWMTSARRTGFNFALEHAVARALELDRPLVILEALRVDYPWASERLHTFVVQGMADNARALGRTRATYYPYIEPRAGDAKGLLRALAAHACLVVADDSPAFFMPQLLAAAARQVDVALEAVDGNGIVPLRVTTQAYPTAYAFRRFVHPFIAREGVRLPAERPLTRVALPRLEALPGDVTSRWPPTQGLDDVHALVAPIAVDRAVGAVATTGGSRAAGRTLQRFLDRGLAAYARDRNDPDADGASGLSPYLHFGQIGAHEIIARVIEAGEWTPDTIETSARGSRAGWGAKPAADFLDQLVTWRELGFNMCTHRPDYDRFESLPDWALRTHGDHASDPREWVYDLEAFAAGHTHDALWNAAQSQLRTTGTMHNYLRMLWGKKILEWTPSPRTALHVMVELNNRFALDGRDPNSYSGIFWTLGRYDRAWGPERPVFGKVRYMSSANTRRKLNLARYLARYGEGDAPRARSLG